MKSPSPHFPPLIEYAESARIVDCHDHATKLGPKYTDPLQVVVGEYLAVDLNSALPEADANRLLTSDIPWEERWPLFDAAWQRCRHTGFAQITRRVLQEFYDEEEPTIAALKRVQERLLDLENPALYESILDAAGIIVRLEDVWPDVGRVLDGSFQLTPRGRLVIPLPGYHRVTSYQQIQAMVSPLHRTVATLDDYLAACFEIFQGFKRFGAVAFKDQSAYFRSLTYGNPPRAAAETIFNRLLADPLTQESFPDGVRDLDDYLFHAFLRMARELDLPVQLHTGHLAGLYGDVRQSNAIQLANLLLLHKEVRFDLFHANWPYGGEFIYLGKNFPNVALNFCWANMIDPIYCQRLFRQALSAVPHGKIHGFGSDFGGFGLSPGGGYPERAWAQARLTRENIAIALAEMVDLDYLSLEAAKEVISAWLYDNPKRFYRLDI